MAHFLDGILANLFTDHASINLKIGEFEKAGDNILARAVLEFNSVVVYNTLEYRAIYWRDFKRGVDTPAQIEQIDGFVSELAASRGDLSDFSG